MAVIWAAQTNKWDSFWQTFERYPMGFIMRRTFTIELKADLTDDQFDAYANLCRSLAKQMLAFATILSAGQRPPLVAIQSEDLFIGPKEVELWKEGEEAKVGTEDPADSIFGSGA